MLQTLPTFAADGSLSSCGTYTWKTRVLAEGPLTTRTVHFTDDAGSMVTFCRAITEEDQTGGFAGGYVTLASLQLGEDARIWARNHETGGWTVRPLSQGLFRSNTVYLESGSQFYLIDLPGSYRMLQNGVVQEICSASSYLRCEKAAEGRGFQVQIVGFCPEEAGFTDCLIYRTGLKADWSLPNAATQWASYTEDGMAKWLFDGYYRTVPAAYTPTCSDGYYRCAASFLLAVLQKQLQSCSETAPLLLACLEVVMEQQNEDGFWATLPQSNWLYEDYNIEAGFYDTRFNTDLMLLVCDLAESLGELPFEEHVRRYVKFYTQSFLPGHSRTAKEQGILPYDYAAWQQQSPAAPALTSLNHLAAETLLLYRLSALLKEPSLADTADRLLLAIEETGAEWVRPDHDLSYGVTADGIFCRKDYASLTYDDLLTLQRWLIAGGKGPSAVIDGLLAEKKQWMDANGIKDYLK
ncbi:MAG: hypothetical protein HUJ80_05955 [Firmicutes bacterium]|nr:hypothetical protein [Bacillota bacterium]